MVNTKIVSQKANVFCSYCNIKFYKSLSKQKKSKSGLFFCSKEHMGIASRKVLDEFGSVTSQILKTGPNKVSNCKAINIYSCLFCNNSFNKVKNFCDRDCANKYFQINPWKTCKQCRAEKSIENFNNDSSALDGKNSKCKICISSNHQKRNKRLCDFCKINYISKIGAKMCKPCRGKERTEKAISMKLSELSQSNKHPDTIRAFARSMHGDIFTECFECEYNEHVDVCHIKDIYLFDLNSTIKEVNALSNLVALCKTHHWEFDQGYKIEGLDSSHKPNNNKKATKILWNRD